MLVAIICHLVMLCVKPTYLALELCGGPLRVLLRALLLFLDGDTPGDLGAHLPHCAKGAGK